MNDETTPRHYVSLTTDKFVECPLQLPELVELDDPATHVFIDFTHNRPALINDNVSVDVALQKMKNQGLRMLLVIDEPDINKRSVIVKGQITSCDILGDIPVKLAQESGIKHCEMNVKMIMTPHKDIQVVDWSTIKVAKVGHIIETMHQHECCHILVVDEGQLRGIFSMSEISRHLGHSDAEPMACAHSLAELVHTIG